MLDLLLRHFDEAEKEPKYNGMVKLDVDRTHPDMIQAIEHYKPHGYKFARGNFFQHAHPYYPHVDGYADEVNVLVPLRMESDEPQKFIVFDQTFPRPATWSVNPNLGEYKVNKLRRCTPGEDREVFGLTGKVCKQAPLLPGSSMLWFGLNGTVYDWAPGTTIYFQSSHIHATGRQQGTKLGLTLIYRRG